jgi:hypothetical protein
MIKLMRPDKNNFFAIIKLISELFIAACIEYIALECALLVFNLMASQIYYYTFSDELYKGIASRVRLVKIKTSMNPVITCKSTLALLLARESMA